MKVKDKEEEEIKVDGKADDPFKLTEDDLKWDSDDGGKKGKKKGKNKGGA